MKADSLDLLSMSIEELQAWASDERPIPFKLFPLHTNEGRYAFLEEYIYWGNERLFEAVSHIWGLLNDPREARCSAIGLAAGTGGTGKWALAKFLKKALRSALESPTRMPSPEGKDLYSYHSAAMAFFEADRRHYQKAVQYFADILGGQDNSRTSPPDAKLLFGPWISDHARTTLPSTTV